MASYKPAELAVIMPVYNEEKIIVSVLEKWSTKLHELNISYEIHVYNDGSKDGTSFEISRYAREREDIFVHPKENSGHGPTILLGYRENIEKEWIFQVDSDDEMSPDQFHILWQKRDRFDFLIGRRLYIKKPLSRAILSIASRWVVNIFYGDNIYDVNSPYRLMKSILFKDYINSIPQNTFAPNVIISGVASLKKFSIFEVPVIYNYRKTGLGTITKATLIKAAIKSFLQTIRFRFQL